MPGSLTHAQGTGMADEIDSGWIVPGGFVGNPEFIQKR